MSNGHSEEEHWRSLNRRAATLMHEHPSTLWAVIWPPASWRYHRAHNEVVDILNELSEISARLGDGRFQPRMRRESFFLAALVLAVFWLAIGFAVASSALTLL
jgi:hypothetical protein